MGWLETLLLAALMAGLMGGLHCAAMCGGIVCLFNARRDAQQAQARWRLSAAYNTGRIASYAVAGAIVGGAGQAGLSLRGALPLQQMLMLAASITLCVMALYLAGVASVAPMMRGLESAGTVLWRRVEPLARRLLPVDSAGKALGLGALWGWLPCGMVYAALLLALSSGDPLHGALVMLAFGLGTLPNLLLIGGAAVRLRHARKHPALRWIAAALLAAAGIYGLMHAVHPGAHAADGWLCRVAPGWFTR